MNANPPAIIAHRGASGHAPENTIAAFRKAHALGAHWIEFDCMLSKDGRIVVSHDETLDRVAGVSHRVCDLALADLVHLDVGAWFSRVFAGETIPLFRDVVTLLHENGMGANVEIKPCRGFERETGEAVAKEIAAHWPSSVLSPVVSSFSEQAFKAAKQFLPDHVETAILWWEFADEPEKEIQRVGADALHCRASELTEARVRPLVKAGIPVRAYTVNDPDDATALFNMGVTSIFTDYPDRFFTR